jgi:hypothetical protein
VCQKSVFQRNGVCVSQVRGRSAPAQSTTQAVPNTKCRRAKAAAVSHAPAFKPNDGKSKNVRISSEACTGQGMTEDKYVGATTINSFKYSVQASGISGKLVP